MQNLSRHAKHRKKGILISFFFMALTFVFPTSIQAFEVKNSEYEFRLKVPDEFETFDVLASLRGAARQMVADKLLYGFVSGGDSENPWYTHFLIERSSVWMTASPLPLENRSVLENAWKGIDVYLYRSGDGFQNGRPTRITLTAAVPLKAGPIQLKLSGPAENEKEMMATLEAALASLEAEASLFAGTSKYSYLLVPLGLLAFSVFAFRNAG